MATLNTITRKVPKVYRNKRIYQSPVPSSVNNALGTGADPPGYFAGQGLELTEANYFQAVPDDVTLGFNPSLNINVKDGGISAQQLASNAVTTDKILNDAVTGVKIADNAIESNHITDLNVSTDKLGNSAVTQVKIADSAVAQAKIANSAVVEAKIGTGAVTLSKLATDSVSTDKIVAGNVTSSKLANSVVSTVKINDLAVTTAKINDLAVTNAKVAAAAVDTANIVSDAVEIGQIAENTVTGIGNVQATQTTPSGSSTWVQVLQQTINSNQYSVGDIITVIIGVTADAATCSAGLQVLATDSGSDYIPGSGAPELTTDILGNTNELTLITFELHILSTTKCAYFFKYHESGTDGSQNDKGAVFTLTNNTFPCTLSIKPYIRDTAGGDDVYIEFNTYKVTRWDH